MGLCGADSATIKDYRAVDITQIFNGSVISQYSGSGRVWGGCRFGNNIKG
jgi:hypothetical protein